MLLLLHAEVIQLCDHCPYECTLICYWGEPERAPHKREVHVVGLSVCLSFCPYVHDTKIYKSSTNLRGTFSC